MPKPLYSLLSSRWIVFLKENTRHSIWANQIIYLVQFPIFSLCTFSEHKWPCWLYWKPFISISEVWKTSKIQRQSSEALTSTSGQHSRFLFICLPETFQFQRAQRRPWYSSINSINIQTLDCYSKYILECCSQWTWQLSLQYVNWWQHIKIN